ncbi:DUF6193 family natural product biosynthesis protein [Streptomyces sp. NPDC058052]|uniref:DUF6193 family natural product biosynthesis protein n=1 Tax=Streptomyces sp. NPDC058052 TaxID=3346316 RepID=UPI0036F08B60
MTSPPEPAVLFPDIAAAGSLAAALRAVAAGALDDVPLTSPAREPLSGASAGSVLPYREAMRVSAWRHERKWSVGADDPLLGLSLIHGVTDDLAQVARALRAWHDGAAPDGVHAVAPFARPTGRSELTEPDPARLVESEWRHLRTEAAELDTPWADAYRALVEAAHAEPRLRALYPFTSHWSLRFSAATRPYLDVVGPNLECAGEDGYRVAVFMTERGRPFATAPEAVAEAVRLLPEELGPTRFGDARPGAGNAVEAAEEA